MAGLDPATQDRRSAGDTAHDENAPQLTLTEYLLVRWVAGSSPAMTAEGLARIPCGADAR